MTYPYCLRNTGIDPFPLLGPVMGSAPFLMPLTLYNEDLRNIDLTDQKALQTFIDTRFRRGYSWGIAGYLEYRAPMLQRYPQMQAEGRYFHLGFDIAAAVGTPLYAPLDATVEETGYEEGAGNYGGFALLKHCIDDDVFYSFYGHLDRQKLPAKSTSVGRGTVFARMGDYDTNGQWFFHTHLQILTQRGLDNGFISKGYCSAEGLKTIELHCPSPFALLRWTTKGH